MIRNRHWALYGGVRLIRMYCEKCKGMTIVIDNEKQCCGEKADNKKDKGFEVMLSTNTARRKPSKRRQRKILEFQESKCIYCGKPFGTMYIRKGKILYTRVHFDHLIPFSYTLSCEDIEFVAACNICNNIKSNKMFETIKEVFYYVEHNRKKKGYCYPEDSGSNNLSTMST